jgi:hypothetical protein
VEIHFTTFSIRKREFYISTSSVCISVLRSIFLDKAEIMFLSIFVMEMLLKIYGLGPSTYFRSTFNTFDFVVSDCPGLDKTYSP